MQKNNCSNWDFNTKIVGHFYRKVGFVVWMILWILSVFAVYPVVNIYQSLKQRHHAIAMLNLENKIITSRLKNIKKQGDINNSAFQKLALQQLTYAKRLNALCKDWICNNIQPNWQSVVIKFPEKNPHVSVNAKMIFHQENTMLAYLKWVGNLPLFKQITITDINSPNQDNDIVKWVGIVNV